MTLSETSSSPEQHAYVIEVCKVCGGQLNSKYNPAGRGGSAPTGRCGTDPSHWEVGGVLLKVVPVPLDEQVDQFNKANLVSAGIVPTRP